MKKIYLLIALVVVLALSTYIIKDKKVTPKEMQTATQTQENKILNPEVKIFPVNHASLVITWGDKTIYVDPVGGADLYKDFPRPDYILITHIHPDHMDAKTVSGVSQDNTTLFVSSSVADSINTPSSKIKGGFMIMHNGVTTSVGDQKISIHAVPAYNVLPEQQMFHPKGRDNGYIIEKDGFRVYVAGDTSGTPEMRALKNIDIAFVPMNLPYTMTVAEAASTTLEFKPKQVWPYHYREKDGFADVQKFKELINKANPNIEVVLAKWY
jgi:L-ascorbate metabolism protein UlaG (beta-lactamase superfamily)